MALLWWVLGFFAERADVLTIYSALSKSASIRRFDSTSPPHNPNLPIEMRLGSTSRYTYRDVLPNSIASQKTLIYEVEQSHKEMEYLYCKAEW